jgi:hypothetical protein
MVKIMIYMVDKNIMFNDGGMGKYGKKDMVNLDMVFN